ncbi:MAG: DsbA family oxidoreductase [Rhizobiaceae bacterium]|nr:DsbA family oxidoreductase [Rhizobiaceae bacterium]
MTKKLTIDVISDVMCPWCYIGKKNLDKAIASMPDLDVEVSWRPYQLDPTLPKEGKDRQKYLNDKFGGQAEADSRYDNIKKAGTNVGIEFDFKAMKVSPNTLDAHRVIRWAGGLGTDVQNKLVRRLFELFFLEGGHIGNDDVLVDAAIHAGMDGDLVRELLASDRDKTEVQQEIAQAQQMGVTGVPCFVIDQKFAVMGAQPPEALTQAFQQALDDSDG